MAVEVTEQLNHKVPPPSLLADCGGFINLDSDTPQEVLANFAGNMEVAIVCRNQLRSLIEFHASPDQ